MRVPILLLIIAAHASAQSDAGKLLAQGLQGALAALTPVSEQDQAAVLKATAELLAKHVTFLHEPSLQDEIPRTCQIPALRAGL